MDPITIKSLYVVVMFFLCHLVGDYFLQSDWMAMNKSKKSWNCFVHCVLYTACFLVLTLSWKALLFIGITHFIFDRWPIIIKRLIWTKNHLNPRFSFVPFEYCDTTGYYDDSKYNTKSPDNVHLKMFGQPRLFIITIWLYIITDNTLHLICNLIALTLFSTTK